MEKSNIIKEFFGTDMAPMTAHEKEISDKYEERNRNNPIAYCQHDEPHCDTCSLTNYGLDCHNNPIWQPVK